MSLAKGDHLRIQRNGKLVEPEAEAYHEFEVLGSLDNGEVSPYIALHWTTDAEDVYAYYDIRIRVIK